MKIFLTGATGFIGKNLIENLKGHELFCLVRSREKFESIKGENVFPVYGDIREDLPDLPEAEVIIHNAAVVRAPSKTYYEVNTAGTLALLNKAKKIKTLKKFIFISSQAVSGPAGLNRPAEESDEPRPVSDYGKSKALAEKLVRESSLPYLILRPAAVYGPGDRDLFVTFKMVKNGLAFLPSGERFLNFINVKDVCAGIEKALFSTCVNDTFFLAHPEPQTQESFVRAIAAAADKKCRVLRVPSPFLKLAGAFFAVTGFFTRKTALLNPQKVREITAGHWIVNTERMLRGLNFHPAYDLKRGAALTLKWYEDQGWL
ncbi:MAG: NAD(P)-dependent oxidoreductase [Elusimicrobiota bacterium]|nr:NAD(P)-dependent oxidoreductase [Elusimicrobiota bacterium]